MKILLVVLFSAVCASTVVFSDEIDGDPDLAAYLREAIENFRDQMTKGIPEIKLPVLDPLVLRDLNINVKENVADINLLMKEIVVSGLKNFTLLHLKANLEEYYLEMNLTVPLVTTAGEYSLHGKVMTIFPVDSDANFTIDVDSICLGAGGQFEIVNDTLRLKHLELDLMWQDINMDLTNGLKTGGLADVLQKLVPDVIRKAYISYQPIILNFFQNLIVNQVNRALDTTEVKNIVKYLKSFSDI